MIIYFERHEYTGIDRKIYFVLPLYSSSGMATPMNEKPVRKPRNVKIDPEALHRARVEALRSKRTVGELLEKATEEKIEREEKKLK